MANYKFNIYKLKETNPRATYKPMELKLLTQNPKNYYYKYTLYYNLDTGKIMYYNSSIKNYSNYYNKRTIKNEILKNESGNICSSIRAYIKANFKQLKKNNLLRIGKDNYFLITKEIFL